MKYISLFALVSASIPAMAFANSKIQTTTLPLPVNQQMQQQDKPSIDFVVGLPVYQDSVDAKQYYYIPKLQASVNADGVSATFIKNEVAVSSSSLISDLSMKLSNLTSEEYFNARKVVMDLQKVLDDAIKANPSDPNIAVYQNYLNKALERKKAAEANVSSFQGSLPAGVLTSMYNNITTLFSNAGIYFPLNFGESITERHNRLNQSLVALNSSNGGLITGNIYGGFTADELLKIKTYKNNYAQDIRIAIMPMSGLSFESLTELQYDANGVKSQRAGIPIFSSLKGGGNLAGATFNFDLTTNGAVSFARNLSPFIPPIAVKGVLKQQVSSYKAILDCDFTSGMLPGVKSVINKQVAVYQDNIVSNLIPNVQQAQSACKLTMISGDKEAAYIAAVQAIEKEIGQLQIQKSNLSPGDKSQYWQQVQQQNQQIPPVPINDQTQQNGYQNVFQAYQQSGWEQSASTALSNRPNFYWQTNVQDLASLKGLKIHKELASFETQAIQISIPTNLCFVWNVNSRAYRACNPGEQSAAVPLTDASQAASQSQSCVGYKDANQCGNNRNIMAPTSPEGNILPDFL
ncbi:hypothetical protein [Silvanigrella aquatica]|uniref:Uncharacterized protein n=1 Tax=Silvanigrella aquatica TaxID=1915309 RepID=A0A1L4D2G9_9BACT|nr:hypothetical protein [Silvanigrella aquatica]APJ04403.1 hypothetical protein AXG55_10990 [Silvanigrella aquatica]